MLRPQLIVASCLVFPAIVMASMPDRVEHRRAGTQEVWLASLREAAGEDAHYAGHQAQLGGMAGVSPERLRRYQGYAS